MQPTVSVSFRQKWTCRIQCEAMNNCKMVTKYSHVISIYTTQAVIPNIFPTQDQNKFKAVSNLVMI